MLESARDMIRGTEELPLRPRFGMTQLCDFRGSTLQFPISRLVLGVGVVLVIAVTAQVLWTGPASMTRSELFSLWSCCLPEDHGPGGSQCHHHCVSWAAFGVPIPTPRARDKGIHHPDQTFLPLQHPESSPDRLGWDGGEQGLSQKTFPVSGNLL